MFRAIGAVVARFLDTEEVTGSNPVSPTSTKQPLTCEDAGQGPFSSVQKVVGPEESSASTLVH